MHSARAHQISEQCVVSRDATLYNAHDTAAQFRSPCDNQLNTFNVSRSHFATETVTSACKHLHRSRRRQMRLAGRATVVGIMRAPSISEDGGVPKACDTKGGGRAGAVVVDVGPDRSTRPSSTPNARRAPTARRCSVCVAYSASLCAATSHPRPCPSSSSRSPSPVALSHPQWYHLPRRRRHPWAPASPPMRAPRAPASRA